MWELFIALKRIQKDDQCYGGGGNVEIFSKMGLRRYCCKQMFVGHQELIDGMLLYETPNPQAIADDDIPKDIEMVCINLEEIVL